MKPTKRRRAREFYAIFIIDRRLAITPRFKTIKSARKTLEKENLTKRCFIAKVREVLKLKGKRA